MSTKDTSKAKSIFLDAIENHTPDSWTRFVDDACGDDEALRGEVGGLLDAHREKDSLFDLDPTKECRGGLENAGQSIGPYFLRERLGTGGMGVVWAAEQKAPLRRMVALKVIKPGMDSEQVIARFEAEREALSLMEHANIARVLDAGATDQGRPYFVMELIRGVPITDYCDQQKLSIQARLELFIPVCRAVQHAHTKGVIHRDIKPSNVLVTEQDGRPMPKVIDFGVAKAIHAGLIENRAYTGVFEAIGTLMYMSPEQAGLSSEGVDTRTDVYGLGVLLYELLTGTTPFEKEELESAALDEALRIVRDREPPKPSTRCSQITRRSRGPKLDDKGSARLWQFLRGDPDLVVMKALSKDRTQRYDDPKGLADDVQRLVDRRPVEAAPPSLYYRGRKLWSEYGLAIGTTALVVAALTVGFVAAVRSSARAHQAEAAERQAKNDAVLATEAALEESQKARRLLYHSRMNDAWHAWNSGFPDRAERILSEYENPRSRGSDHRGFEWYYLRNLIAKSTGRIILKSPVPAHSVSFSQTGILAVAYHENVVLYDFNSHTELPVRFQTKLDNSKSFTIAEQNYWSFPFAVLSESGKYLAYVPRDQPATLRVTDLITNKTVEMPGHGQTVRHAAFSPDGTFIVTGDHDGSVRLWNVADGKLEKQGPHHKGLVWAVAFSPDGETVASGGADNRIQLWNWNSDERSVLTGHYSTPSTVDGVIAVAFSPDGDFLVSGGADRTVRVWDVERRETGFVLTGHLDEVRSVAFSPDGTLVASGGRDNCVRIWDTETRLQIAQLMGPTRIAHSIAFSPDGAQVIAASFDGSVTEWEVPSRSTSVVTYGEVQFSDIVMSPSGKLIAVARRASPTVEVLGSQQLDVLFTIELPNAALALSFDSKGNLAALDADGILTRWDLSNNSPKKMFAIQSVVPHFARHAIQCSPDDEVIAVGGANGEIWLHNMSDGGLLRTLSGHHGPVNSLAFGNSNTYLVSSAEFDEVRRWNLATEQHKTLLSKGIALRSLCIHRGTLYVGGPEGISVFEYPFEDRSKLLETGATEVQSLDDRTLAICGGGRGQRVSGIRIWDLQEDSQRFALRGHTGAVTNLCVSENGKTVVSASFDGTIRVWRSESQKSVP